MPLVTVTAFEDLACGDCADYAQMLDLHLAPKYGRQVLFVEKDFPLEKHEWAYDAAAAARFLARHSPPAAHRFRRYCMRERHRISKLNLGPHFERFAQESGVEVPAIGEVLMDAEARSAVDHDLAEGGALGIDRTPTVFAGARKLVEPFSLEQAIRAIGEAIAAEASVSR